MPTFVDLLWQVKNKLPIKFGGTGNDLGAARNMVMLSYDNDTGGAIALGTLVKLHGSSFDDLRVIPTTTANELGVLGVVVGRFTQGDGLGLFEAVAPAHQDTVAVAISGRCRVLVESSVTQGQYAYAAATDGKAAGTSSVPLGQIGIFESDGTTSALVVLGNRAAITAPEDVYEDGVLQVDGFHILDFGAHLDVSADGTTAAVAVVTDDMTLEAEQVLVEDVGTYYTPDAPTTGTETLRPDSDVVQSGSVTYSSGTTAYVLVDESVLDTGDYYNPGNNAYVIHGFPDTALTLGQRIDSVQIRCNTTNTAPAATAQTQVRDPNTGTRYDVKAIGQNSAADAGEVLLTTRPWDSQPWELTDILQLQVGFAGPGSSANLRVRQMYVEINWTRRVTVESALAELGSLATGGDVLVHTTSEMDDSLVLAPDGAGGVEFRAETGGGGGGSGTFIGAKAYHSTTQGSLAASTINALSLDSEEFDTDGFHDTSTNNSRMTIPSGKGGNYLIIGKTKLDQAFGVYIYKNGTTLLRGGDHQDGGNHTTVSVIEDLVAGDYVQLVEFHASGTGTAGDASNDHLRAELSIAMLAGGSSGGGGELDYVAFTSPVNVTATTEATANTIVTGSAVAYDGSTVVVIQFFSPSVAPQPTNAQHTLIYLYDGSSSIGLLGQFTHTGTTQQRWPANLSHRLTPSNATHTYSIRATTGSGTAVINAGAGGTPAIYMPGFIRITQA